MLLLVADDYPCRSCEKKYCQQNCQKFNTWLDTIIEAEPVVHGRWEKMDEYCNHSREFKCTACKQSVFYDHFTRFCEYDYCPNCGAKMDGVKKDG